MDLESMITLESRASASEVFGPSRFCQVIFDTPNSTPLGSSRAPAPPRSGSQRGLTTSSRRAPGWNRTALAKASFEAKAVFRMFRPALSWRSISQSHRRHTNTLPTLSRRLAPHAGQVFDVHRGLTLITGTPSKAALYSI